MDLIGIYVREGHEFKEVLKTSNIITFRKKIDELISHGTRASDIIISDGHDLKARIMEGLEYGN